MQNISFVPGMVKYLQERLAEDKLPAKYDPRIAHKVFDFIDPTWAPGVTAGWLEDRVHESDALAEKPDDEPADEETDIEVRVHELTYKFLTLSSRILPAYHQYLS